MRHRLSVVAQYYSATAAALSAALRYQQPEQPGETPPPRTPHWTVLPQALCFTYGPTGFVGRLSVHVGLLHIGDVVVFPTGYRAYLPDDTPVAGLHPDRETAAVALWRMRG